MCIQSLIYLIPLCHRAPLFSKNYSKTHHWATLLHWVTCSFITTNSYCYLFGLNHTYTTVVLRISTFHHWKQSLTSALFTLLGEPAFLKKTKGWVILKSWVVTVTAWSHHKSGSVYSCSRQSHWKAEWNDECHRSNITNIWRSSLHKNIQCVSKWKQKIKFQDEKEKKKLNPVCSHASSSKRLYSQCQLTNFKQL